MKHLRAMLAFVAFSISASFATADPPRIVATPSPEVVVVPVGEPVKLDVGKFRWLYVAVDKAGKSIDRPVTWYFETPGIADKPDGGTEVLWGGLLQGQDRPAWHKVPKGSVPIFGGGDKIDEGKFKFFEVPSIGEFRIGGTKQGEQKAGWHKPDNPVMVPVLGVAKGLVKVSAWVVVGDKVETAKPEKLAEMLLSVDGGKEEKKEDDKKVEPKPVVKSFRVILGYESGQTMTQAQTNILFGNVVEEYLNASCTGGRSGWRRRDKDAAGDNDPAMAAMWNAVKPIIAAVPFVAIEVNGGKPEIISFERTAEGPKKGVTYTPAEFVELLKTYSGGK